MMAAKHNSSTDNTTDEELPGGMTEVPVNPPAAPVVVTVTVTAADVALLKSTVAGDAVQLDNAGPPVQLNETVPANPDVALTLRL